MRDTEEEMLRGGRRCVSSFQLCDANYAMKKGLAAEPDGKSAFIVSIFGIITGYISAPWGIQTNTGQSEVGANAPNTLVTFEYLRRGSLLEMSDL